MRAHIYNLVEEDVHSDPKQPGHCLSKNQHTDKSATNQHFAAGTDNSAAAATGGNITSSDNASGEDESIALSLVQDLLDCMQLTYTSSVLKAELRQNYAQWPRRRIAEVLQLDLDEPATSNTSDTSRTPLSPAVRSDAAAVDQDAASNKEPEETEPMASDLPTSASSVATVPLLVEILRRLPKTTDESSMTTATNKEDGEDSTIAETDHINNDTFVAMSRSANMTSESL